MSRTYRRRDHIERDCDCGAPIEPKVSWTYKNESFVMHESVQEEINSAKRHGVPPERTCDCDTWFPDYTKRNCKRDRKNWNKSDSSFKKVMKKARRAKERAAMGKGDYENIPIFHKENDWLWN